MSKILAGFAPFALLFILAMPGPRHCGGAEKRWAAHKRCRDDGGQRAPPALAPPPLRAAPRLGAAVRILASALSRLCL